MSGATVYQFDSDNRISGQWQVTDRLGVYRILAASTDAMTGETRATSEGQLPGSNGGSTSNSRCLPEIAPTSVLGVRRAKAALSSG